MPTKDQDKSKNQTEVRSAPEEPKPAETKVDVNRLNPRLKFLRERSKEI